MSKAYEKIAEVLLSMTDEAGKWQPCWHMAGLRTPVNGVTGHIYQGINVLVLWASGLQQGFEGFRWATYQQWQEAGAQVTRGQKGTPIVFWKKREVETDEGPEERWFARGYTVFHRDQVASPPPVEAPAVNADERIAEVEIFIANVQKEATIVESEDCDIPCYRFKDDKVVMPPFTRFVGAVEYYGTLLHELTHWTGHETREHRELQVKDKEKYAFEELVAELGSAFLAADLGLEPEPRADHAQYLAHWHKLLKNDVAAFAHAAALARRAAARLNALGKEMEDA